MLLLHFNTVQVILICLGIKSKNTSIRIGLLNSLMHCIVLHYAVALFALLLSRCFIIDTLKVDSKTSVTCLVIFENNPLKYQLLNWWVTEQI